MKKLFALLLFSMLSLSVHAQIFDCKMVVDRFDDIVKSENRKTIVTVRNDGKAIVFEEKGKKPKAYLIEYTLEDCTLGSKDHFVNIVDNLYGYDESFMALNCVYSYKLKALNRQLSRRKITAAKAKEKRDKISVIITHRYTEAHDASRKREFWIIINQKTGLRTVYTNLL